MKTPVWVWDWKQEIYLTLPKDIQQFEDGKWGYDMLDYIDNTEASGFCQDHKYLFKFIADKWNPIGWKMVLKNTRPQDKHWYSKPQARITKVQRS